MEFSDPKSFDNLEELFNITQGEESGWADPKPSSLYNIQTLKAILSAGEQSIDITQAVDTPFADAISSQQQ